jgi:hypothetical protein
MKTVRRALGAIVTAGAMALTADIAIRKERSLGMRLLRYLR